MITKIGYTLYKEAGVTPATLKKLRKAGLRYTSGDKKYMAEKAQELNELAESLAQDAGYTIDRTNNINAFKGGGGVTLPDDKTIYLTSELSRKKAGGVPLLQHMSHDPVEAKKLREAVIAYHEALEAQGLKDATSAMHFSEFIPEHTETVPNYIKRIAKSFGSENNADYLKILEDSVTQAYPSGVIPVPANIKAVGQHMGAHVLAGETREISKMPRRVQRALTGLKKHRLSNGTGEVPYLARQIGMDPKQLYKRPLTDAEYGAMVAVKPKYGSTEFDKTHILNEVGNEKALEDYFIKQKQMYDALLSEPGTIL